MIFGATSPAHAAAQTTKVDLTTNLVRSTFEPTPLIDRAGTPRDPHVYLGYIREHRALRPGTRDYIAFWGMHAAIKKVVAQLGSHGYVYRTALTKLENAELPFETMTNMVDGSRWGKFYDVGDETLIIKPAPDTSLWAKVKDAATYIGDAIVWIASEVWEGILWFCEELETQSSNELRKDAAYAIIGAVASPATAATVASAVETARQICKGAQFINAYGEGDQPPPGSGSGSGSGSDSGSGDRPNEKVSAKRGGSTPTIYPSGAFAIYDANLSRFRVLVPKETS
jgi:hypothetical protein